LHEDGSALFTVPAGRNLYFQALDENYMELQRMRTFVNLKPGEKRSCVGCHESRKLAALPRRALPSALREDPRSLVGQPGDTVPRTVHYPTDVQPVLDRYCVSCHAGERPKAQLDLSGELTTLFNRSYENLIRRNLVNKVDVSPRDAFIPARDPLTFGSHRSRLVQQIRRKDGPCNVGLTRKEFVRLVTWIDANAPYYGLYEGKRNLKWKETPDFRPDPVVSCGATYTPERVWGFVNVKPDGDKVLIIRAAQACRPVITAIGERSGSEPAITTDSPLVLEGLEFDWQMNSESFDSVGVGRSVVLIDGGSLWVANCRITANCSPATWREAMLATCGYLLG
jgi:hypothetical protein